MAAREVIRLTPEATWGTFNGSETNHVLVDIDGTNVFDMRPMPVQQPVRTAGALNRKVTMVSAKTALNGSLKLLPRGSQMSILCGLLDNAGAPKSFTVDHKLLMDDSGSTAVYRRYLGCKVKQYTFTADESGQVLRLATSIVAKQPATITVSDLAEPALTDYASDAFFTLEQATVTYHAARTNFDKFSLKVDNKLDPRFFNGQYLAYLPFLGRDAQLDLMFPYILTTDRADYEANTARAASVAFVNGSYTLTIQLNGASYLTSVKDDIALDKLHCQGITADVFMDATAGSDLTVTST